MVELDHVFCFVDPAADWAERLGRAGWRLDQGIEHPGQGTRNRRLLLPGNFLELVWLSSRSDAEANPLRLDRRADWRTTGACPFGIGLRGELANRDAFWPYRPPYAPEFTLWVHRADDTQPFVFQFEVDADQLAQLRARLEARPELVNPGPIREIRLQLPVAAPTILDHLTPRIVARVGPPRMELVVGGAALEVTPELALI